MMSLEGIGQDAPRGGDAETRDAEALEALGASVASAAVTDALWASCGIEAALRLPIAPCPARSLPDACSVPPPGGRPLRSTQRHSSLGAAVGAAPPAPSAHAPPPRPAGPSSLEALVAAQQEAIELLKAAPRAARVGLLQGQLEDALAEAAALRSGQPVPSPATPWRRSSAPTARSLPTAARR